jgi:V8-like Glu-specific endopeptidase
MKDLRPLTLCRELTARILLVAGVLAAALLWTAVSAAGTHSTTDTFRATHTRAQVLAYWTEQRMANARSADLSVASVHLLPGAWSAPISTGSNNVAGHRGSGAVVPFAARGMTDENDQTAYQIYGAGFIHVNVVGRLYYREPNGVPYTCSGTVVSRDVVVTAGHCAYTAPPNAVTGWNSMEMFVPDKYGSSKPYGSWAIATSSTWPRWRQSGWWPHDYAFLKIAPDSAGRHIGDLTGTAGLVIDATTIDDIWSIGYPRTGFFRTWDGEYSYYCYSPYSSPSTVADSDGVVGYDIGYGCYMTGGASGGPMFVNYQGSWINVVSVNSHCWPVGCNGEGANVWSRNLWGPYFDDDTLSLFNTAVNS